MSFLQLHGFGFLSVNILTKLVQQKEERRLEELQQAERLLEKVEKKKQYIESKIFSGRIFFR